MGYCIEMINSTFVIKKENFDKALEALKAVFVPKRMTCCDYINDVEYLHFSWVNTKTVLESNTLQEALKEIRYSPIYNDNGDITDVEFTGENRGDEDTFFVALAPYVEENSILRFVGENDETWSWIFRDGKVEQIYD